MVGSRQDVREMTQVRLFPRRKKQHGGDSEALIKSRPRGTSPLVFTRKAIEDLFSVSQNLAAEKLGVSATSLKKICRQLGITRWPYTKKKTTKKAAEHQLGDSDTSCARVTSSCSESQQEPALLSLRDSSSLGDSEDWTDEEEPCSLEPAAGVLLKAPFAVHSPSPVVHERCAHRDADDEDPSNDATTLAEIKRSAVRAAQRIGDAAQVQVGPASYSYSWQIADDFHDHHGTSSNEDLHWLVPTLLQSHVAYEPSMFS